jgi:hypothetical protein
VTWVSQYKWGGSPATIFTDPGAIGQPPLEAGMLRSLKNSDAF